jgi:hypothetical protein
MPYDRNLYWAISLTVTHQAAPHVEGVGLSTEIEMEEVLLCDLLDNAFENTCYPGSLMQSLSGPVFEGWTFPRRQSQCSR